MLDLPNNDCVQRRVVPFCTRQIELNRQSSAFAPHGIRHGGCLLRRWPKNRNDGPHRAGNLGNVGLMVYWSASGVTRRPLREMMGDGRQAEPGMHRLLVY